MDITEIMNDDYVYLCFLTLKDLMIIKFNIEFVLSPMKLNKIDYSELKRFVIIDSRCDCCSRGWLFV